MSGTSQHQLSRPPENGRVFSIRKKIRLQDTTQSGSTRLDAVARIISEVSEDDLLDFGRPNTGWWVARRIFLDVVSEAEESQNLDCQTWAAGMARVGADRRVSLIGSSGHYEASTVWIAIDPNTGRPTALPEWFASGYAETCGNARTSLQLRHPPVPASADHAVWPLRKVDFDRHGHVNNGAYWPTIEEMLAHYEIERSGRFSVEIEFRSGISMAKSVPLRMQRNAAGLSIWWLVDGRTAASSIVKLGS